MLTLDHVFVCVDRGAPEADVLVRAGLAEAPPNEHPGQGTACRRFAFENAYLELFWVHDPVAAQSEAVLPTGLWAHWVGRGEGACPIGLVLRSDPPSTGPLPFPAWPYRPAYLPQGWSISVAAETPVTEPAVFHLDFARGPDFARRERGRHAQGWRALTGVEIGLPGGDAPSRTLRRIVEAGLVRLVRLSSSETPVLTLTFDGGDARTLDFRATLPLVLRW